MVVQIEAPDINVGLVGVWSQRRLERRGNGGEGEGEYSICQVVKKKHTTNQIIHH